MARIILGTIVTSIRGSIGGNTFKKTKRGFSMGLKSTGPTSSKLFQNSRLGQIGSIFQSWSQLTVELRTAWNEQALLFPFPDGDGGLKYLNGRQLFTKLNLQLTQKFVRIEDPTGINSNTSTVLIGVIDILKPEGTATVAIDQEYGLVDCYIYAQQLLNEAQTANIKKAKFLKYEPNPNNVFVDFGTELVTAFPNFQVGDIFEIFVTPVNAFGFKGVTVNKRTVVVSSI